MAKILVVDDQDMMRDSLAATLVREGHEVIAATDGAAAVTRLNGGKFDLMITDLKMPKMTGIELLAEAKKLRPEMPVVLMTAFATVSTAVEATTRDVAVDILAVKGHAVGATARVLLKFSTEGEVQQDVVVRGRLFLTWTPDGWRIFGYDVTKGRAA